MRNKWSDDERFVLWENFPVRTKTEIEEMFPNRTYYSIYKKAIKMGLKRIKKKETETRRDAQKCRVKRIYRTISQKGYVLVYKPDHHRADSKGFVFEHILIAEEKYGIKITPEQAVHHINEIKTDNRPENIMLFATQGEHTAFHNRQRKLSQDTKEKISRKIHDRYSDPKNHPSHRNLDIKKMMEEIESGMTVGSVCKKYGIVKSTYYRRIKKGDF